MKTIRVDSDLALCFDESGFPHTKTSSSITKDEVDGKVREWLRRHSEESEAYYFVDRWYQEFALPARPTTHYEGAPLTGAYQIARRSMTPPTDRILIWGKQTSACCGAQVLFVRSMAGGFVTQDCVNCGRYKTVAFNELPDLSCKTCGTSMRQLQDERGNYAYACDSCNRRHKFADFLPHWSECHGPPGTE